MAPDIDAMGRFFHGRRILVTGDTGFKGSWLSLCLHRWKADVVGYALPPRSEKDHFNLLDLARKIHHIDGNILDYDRLKKVFDEFQPEILFHLAAQAIVRISYGDPKGTFDTNIGGSINMLEMVRLSKTLRSVVYVTSDKCYRNKEWEWGYRENDELGGDDPYSASKAAAELVFNAYSKSYFAACPELGAASVRAGNVIGGGDWSPDRIVPDSIRALQANVPVEIRNPASTRPWQHVLEPVSGYITLAQHLYEQPQVFRGSWNFGPRTESIQTVRNLVEKIIETWGEGTLEVKAKPGDLHEARLLHLNCDKSARILDWQPRWNFADSVKKTVTWYRAVHDGTPAELVSNRQIQEYWEVPND